MRNLAMDALVELIGELKAGQHRQCTGGAACDGTGLPT
jgi:hypothetical protein